MTAGNICRSVWARLKPRLRFHKTGIVAGLDAHNEKETKRHSGKRIVFFEMP